MSAAMGRRFQDKVVIVTGASSGIGKAAAIEFGREGASVALSARRLDECERTAEAVRAASLAPEMIGPEEPRVLVIGWGSTYHVIREAMEGIGSPDLAFLHLQQVYPLPPEVEWRIISAERVVVVEGNAVGQLAQLIRRETGFDIPDKLLNYSGAQFSVEQVREYLERVLEEVV